MSEDNNTPLEGGGEALPAAEVTTTKVPKSDAEAAALEAKPEGDDAAKAAKEAEASEHKKNRTREYIAKINRENAEKSQRIAERDQRIAELEARVGKSQHAPAAGDGRPTLEQHNFDQDAYLEALADWKVEQHLKAREESTKQAASAKSQQEVTVAYNTKAAEFADEHPDFPEVVGSIKYPLDAALQAAIMAHPKGPEIAYHLGTNDDDAFALASIQPALAAAAVERLASRLTAAHEAPQAPQPPVTPRPVSRAPAPAPTVSGRSPTEIPPEKLTDDAWYARDVERRRKR